MHIQEAYKQAVSKGEKRTKSGFTLMEMLVVVAIIGVLVAVAIPVFAIQLDEAKKQADIANARSLYSLLAADYADDGKYEYEPSWSFPGYTGTPLNANSSNGYFEMSSNVISVLTNVLGIENYENSYELTMKDNSGSMQKFKFNDYFEKVVILRYDNKKNEIEPSIALYKNISDRDPDTVFPVG